MELFDDKIPELTNATLLNIPLFMISSLPRWIPEEHIVVSGDIGVSKPDLEAFRIYERKCCVRPENTVMVGDNLAADIQGAEAAGWNALWVDAGIQ